MNDERDNTDYSHVRGPVRVHYGAIQNAEAATRSGSYELNHESVRGPSVPPDYDPPSPWPVI